MKQFYPFIFLLLAAQTALSAVNTWTGLGGDNNWNTAGNWSDGVPASSSSGEAYFMGGGVIEVNFNIAGTSHILGSFVISGGTQVTIINATGALKIISVTNGTADFQLGSGSTLELQGANNMNLSLGGTGSAHNILGTLNQNSVAGTVSFTNATTVSGTIRAMKPNVNTFTGACIFTGSAVYEIVADNVGISRTLGFSWDPMATIKIIGTFSVSPKFQSGSDAIMFGSLEVDASGVDINMGANSGVRFGGNVNIINANNSFSIGNQVTINGNLEIATDEKMMVNIAAIVKGDILNYGTIEASGTATLEMAGTSLQTIDSENMLGNLIFKVNNAAGVSTTGGVVQIPHTLELTAGLVNTSAGNELGMLANKTVSGGSDASHVNGPMKKTGADAFMFPVGKAGVYAPCGIGAGSDATDVYLAEYFRSEPASSTSFATSGDPMQQLVVLSNVEYWEIDDVMFSTPRKVTLTYRPSSVVNVPAQTRVAHSDGSEWSSMGNTAMGGGSITSDFVSSFSPFTFGGITLAALPAELISFKAMLQSGGAVQLEWQTASEKDMKQYVVERSSNGYTWRTLGQKTAKGNTTDLTQYTLVDQNPLSGDNYYRLRMEGVQGDVQYSSIVYLATDLGEQMTVYPNPSTDAVWVTGASADADAQIFVFDASGRMVRNEQVTDAIHRLELSSLPNGTYIVLLKEGGKELRTNVVKH